MKELTGIVRDSSNKTNLAPDTDIHCGPGIIDGGGNNEHVIFDRLPNIINMAGAGCGEVIIMD